MNSPFEYLISELKPMLGVDPVSGDVLDTIKILDVGSGGFCGEKTTIPLLNILPDSEIVAIEKNGVRAILLRGKVSPPVRVIQADYFLHDFGQERFDLIVLGLDFQFIPEVFASLSGKTESLVNPGGYVIYPNICNLELSKHSYPELKDGRIEEFMMRVYWKTILEPADVRAVFAQSASWEFITAKNRRDTVQNCVHWVALKKKGGA